LIRNQNNDSIEFVIVVDSILDRLRRYWAKAYGKPKSTTLIVRVKTRSEQ